ncbi:MAG: tRNA lysidine(34) synthetase TilS [Agriterribacter sp.]
MNDLLQHFKQFIDKEELFAKNDKLLLAVSGGVDSVVLCHLCFEAGYSFEIAHCNFNLRGEESNRDETFVRTLAKQYNVPMLVKQFDTTSYADARKVSIQVAARELRYAWFNEIATAKISNLPAGRQVSNFKSQIKIVTAHHADDNAETVLMNFFKGTGIAGIRGILPKKGKVVRPLLFASKADLLDYAAGHGVDYVEDSSNLTDKYTRNYFRQHILPAVLNVFPEAEAGIQENIKRFRETELLYNQAIAVHKKKLMEYRGDEVHIPVLKLQQAVPLKTIVYEIIKAFHFSPKQTDEVIELLQSESGKYIVSATHRILKNRNWLIITANEKVETDDNAVTVIDNIPATIAFTEGALKLKKETCEDTVLHQPEHIACINASAVEYPLLLRKWKTGDYFYPLGMRKKKKLARFFIDRKLSLADKERIWVLESNKKIIWIINHRIDDRFKITPGTKECIRIEFLRKV